ncbi:MAG: class I tRNA ligase family protein, partial [Chthoniobacteraceae bacterium]
MSANYKDTLLLPKTDFPMKADLVKREPERLAKWEAAGLYRKVLAARAEAPLFVLHDGPPFANGDVHKRRRAPMVRTFAYKLMDGVRPRVREIAAEVIEAHRGKGPVNFLDDFGRAIPARIIAEIIGAPAQD